MAGNPIDIYSKTNEDDVNENGNWNADTTAIFRKILGSGISFDEESNNNNDNNNNNSNNGNNSNSGQQQTTEVEKREGSSSQIDRFCNGDIPLDYALQAFTDADFVFISHDIRANGKRGSIRGFMCVKNNHNARGDHEEGTLYIDLICNSSRQSARSAAKRQQTGLAGGKILLNAIKAFAVENGYERIALKALETVIPYYYKFGWRFIERCGDEERGTGMGDAVAELSAALKAHHQQNPNMEDLKQNPDINTALVKFKKFLPGIHDETVMRTARYQNDDWEDLMVQDQSTVKLHETETRDNGYAMLWCVPVGSGKQEEKKSGGRRRRRKRRTRKKKMKKSRKTRRKRHHKKRTRRKKRRKRRGGNGRNSKSTIKARERGVNIMPTIREPRVWKMKLANKRTGNNIIRNHINHGVGKTRK